MSKTGSMRITLSAIEKGSHPVSVARNVLKKDAIYLVKKSEKDVDIKDTTCIISAKINMLIHTFANFGIWLKMRGNNGFFMLLLSVCTELSSSDKIRLSEFMLYAFRFYCFDNIFWKRSIYVDDFICKGMDEAH